MALAEYNFIRHGGTKIWISRGFEDPLFVHALAEADRFFDDPECRIIKDQKKIKVGRLTRMIAGKQRAIYIKRYNSFSRRFRLLSPFVRSGALRSIRGASVLHKKGIATARPVAAVENRFYGMLRRSFFVSEEIAAGKTTDAYWLESLRQRKDRGGFKERRAFLRSLASLFLSLHAQQIYHNDLKHSNILVVNNGGDESFEWFLLDLEGVRQYVRLSERRRIKNLVQLYRTLGRYVSRSRQAFFLKCYLGRSFADPKLKRHFVDGVLMHAKSVDRVKARVLSPKS